MQKLLADSGMTEPTEPQEMAIPEIAAGKHVLLIAPTGMGKTEAAVLPVFDKIIRDRPPRPSFIYITPLRALNRDLLRRLRDWGVRLGISVGVRHGDTTQAERAEQVKSPPDLLITTPETLQVLFGGARLRNLVKYVKWVVVDEIHELAGDERGAQMAVALERLARASGEFQRIGLSATVGNPDEVARFLAGTHRSASVLKVPVGKMLKISVECPVQDEHDAAEAERIQADDRTFAGLKRCRDLISHHRSVLLFVNTRDSAEVLASRFRLWKPDFPIGVHHGSLYRDVRIQMEDDFKTEKLKGLICTSSLELGIDVGSVDLTVQHGSPRQAARLVQRVGRSGHRRGKTSEGIIITRDADDVAEAAVLARMAASERVERIDIRENPLGVLANQLVGLAVGHGELSAQDVYGLVKKAYPFRNLERSVFDGVLRQLVSFRILWTDDLDPDRLVGNYSRRRGSIAFFYENLSMIPDQKTYRITDITTRKVIGTLDEAFMATYGDIGVRFIVRGASWRIVEIKEDNLLVEPSPEIGAIPGWIGEEIPVPFEAAIEVGRLRAAGGLEGYPVDDEGRRIFNELLGKQREGNFPLPTDKTITVELSAGGRLVVINACLGSKVNDTLGRLLSAFLSARMASEIGVQTDPYRIVLELPGAVKPETVIHHLRTTSPDDLGKVLRLAITNSSLVRRELLHTARKFGAVDKGADFRQVSFARILKFYRDTPLHDEALDKTLFDRMDIPKTAEILRKIQSGDIEVVASAPSPIGTSGIRTRWETLVSGRVERPILLAFKSRLEKATVRMFCLACRKSARHAITHLPHRLDCGYCGGRMVAAVPVWDEKSIETAQKKSPRGEDLKTLSRLRKNANLVMSHGKRAVLALTARGVGVDTAARILNFQHETEEEFLRAVLAAEVQYARNRRFW